MKLLHYSRILLQVEDIMPRAIASSSVTYSPKPATTSTNISSSPSPELRHSVSSSHSPMDSSMALTILVLLTALFFMAFFSLYIRRFSEDATSSSNQSSPRPPPPIRQRKGNGAGGLDPAAIRSLPLVVYGGDEKCTNDNECSICLSEFEEKETVKVIPYCRHGFHPMCIDTWLASHVTCPLCRSTQLFPAVEEVRLCVARADGE